MLERAAQKLRLDQLVIQQGRTQTSKGKIISKPSEIKGYDMNLSAANKEELLEMIQHGVDKIVHSAEK